MSDDTVTPLWTLTRVRQIDSDTGSLSLTLDGESTPKVEITADGRAAFNTALSVTGPVILEALATALSGLTVTGAVKASGTIEAEQGLAGMGAVPVGAILMWSGSPAKLPAGWYLCNGSGWLANGDPVPDLRGSFIVGHDPASADYKTVGSRGGAPSCTLKVANLPKDDLLTLKQLVVAVPYIPGDNNALSRNVGDEVKLPSNGAAEPFDIRPPWYSLAYIIYGGPNSRIPSDPGIRAVLRAGEALSRGGSVVSPSGRYSLLLDASGRLSLRDDRDRLKPLEIWVAMKDRSDAIGTIARMQADSNFVLYAGARGAVFASDTFQKNGVLLRVTDDGKVRIDDGEGRAIWSKP
ncbi:hypothetical protein [Ancylobacter sp. IITR112]|uniref:hypothetical protein n=1 Tax=Ancylobacter sp. IITR112 TaxID=3138073 RepID=UPI00352B47D6